MSRRSDGCRGGVEKPAAPHGERFAAAPAGAVWGQAGVLDDVKRQGPGRWALAR
jgi:hypothetical protein